MVGQWLALGCVGMIVSAYFSSFRWKWLTRTVFDTLHTPRHFIAETCSGRNHGVNAHSSDQSRIILKDHPCNIHVHHKESLFSKGGRIAWHHSYSDNHCVVLRVQPAAGIVIDGHHYPSMYKQLGHAQALVLAGG